MTTLRNRRAAQAARAGAPGGVSALFFFVALAGREVDRRACGRASSRCMQVVEWACTAPPLREIGHCGRCGTRGGSPFSLDQERERTPASEKRGGSLFGRATLDSPANEQHRVTTASAASTAGAENNTPPSGSSSTANGSSDWATHGNRACAAGGDGRAGEKKIVPLHAFASRFACAPVESFWGSSARTAPSGPARLVQEPMSRVSI